MYRYTLSSEETKYRFCIVYVSSIGVISVNHWGSHSPPLSFFSLLFPPRLFLLPFPFYTFPSSFCLLSPSLRSMAPVKSSYGIWGSAASSAAGSGAETQAKSNSVHFSLTLRRLVATNLNDFPRNQLIKFLAVCVCIVKANRGPKVCR